MPGAVDENILQRRLAHRYRFNFAGKCLYDVGDKTVAMLPLRSKITPTAIGPDAW